VGDRLSRPMLQIRLSRSLHLPQLAVRGLIVWSKEAPRSVRGNIKRTSVLVVKRLMRRVCCCQGMMHNLQ
jgi:hypothetical protein